MSLESWMNARKQVLLNEKKEELFTVIRRDPDFHVRRAELHHVLTRIEQARMEEVYSTIPKEPSPFNIPMVA
ncbi:MAG: hypothetical protein AABY11_03990 [archaeon]